VTVRVSIFVLAGAVLLGLPAAATAAPPALLTVGHQDRHPIATFSAPRAGSVTVYVASKPDRATDGQFLQENVKDIDFLADSEIQSGRWLAESKIDPGRYWLMLRATPDFDTCWDYDRFRGYDPACADGFSNVVTLDVPKPTSRYTTRVTAYRYVQEVTLTLTATPLGEDRAYRVCYRTLAGRMRCVRGTLDGYSWDAEATDSVTAPTRGLALFTTFRWYVDGRLVASKRARVRR
jgi:hypothetical protein